MNSNECRYDYTHRYESNQDKKHNHAYKPSFNISTFFVIFYDVKDLS